MGKLGLVPLLLLSGCTALPVGESQSALGEPNGDFPNYDERVVLYATNRSRVDPAKENWPSYPAVAPLQWNLQLNQSARAHSTDMRDTPCFQHDSCDGTDIWTRITSYYTQQYQSIGENISAGVPDGVTAVHNWINEIGAAAGETGHRDNIFSKDYAFMGTGFAAGGKQYTNYWTQDFVGNPVTRPAMTDGIHFPQTGKSITFGVTWSDAQAPSAIAVVVDGTCTTLAVARGSGGQAAYEAVLMPSTTGCHQYYFRGVSTTKKVWLYPDSGSLQLGASCPLFVAGQMAASCDSSPVSMPDLAPASKDMGGTRSPDLAEPGNSSGTNGNGGTTTGNGGTSDGTSGNGSGTNGGDPPQRADAGCSITPDSPAPWALLIFLLLPFALRRRLG